MKHYIAFICGKELSIGEHLSAWAAYLHARSLEPNAPIGSIFVCPESVHGELPESLKRQA